MQELFQMTKSLTMVKLFLTDWIFKFSRLSRGIQLRESTRRQNFEAENRIEF